MTLNDLLVVFALCCPFVAIAVLLSNDCAAWLSGRDVRDKVGTGRSGSGGACGVRDSGGTTATLTAASVQAGASTSPDEPGQ